MEFIGRESELNALNDMYRQDRFHLFVLYGRRRVGKTTFLNEFCKDKDSIFYSAEQSNDKLNLEKFSAQVFNFYGETSLEPFTSWTNALTYIASRQNGKKIVIVIDEFPYLVRKNRALLSEFQHLVDHVLRASRIFMVLCGSYMGFMEKEVLGSKSPLFGRRTGQLHMKSFDYATSIRFMRSFSSEDKLKLYGAFGGTPLYLEQISPDTDFENNIKGSFLKVTSYLYEEPLLLLRQEVNEPGIYSAVIEAIASGASKSNEIATRIGEEPAKTLKYVKILCELGILYKETPFGEKDSSRKTLYGISDLMFRFWYRYVFANRTLIETGAADAVWEKRIAPDYNTYMGSVFERVCNQWLSIKNSRGELPLMFTSSGRWWGQNSNSPSHEQVEIDIVARDGNNYIFGECKWRNEKLGVSVLEKLREKSDIFSKNRGRTWYFLFSKSGFSDRLIETANNDDSIVLISIDDILGLG